jgi:tetratricopeptide (TPR) repeat protein
MKSTGLISFVLASMLMAPGRLSAQPDAATLADSIQSEIVAAYVRGDDARLAAARALAERAVAIHPEDALLHHYLGFALYRQAAVTHDDPERPRILDAAQAALERSAAIRPLPETHALLASVYGLRIGANPALGASLGHRSGGERAIAGRLGPENPRVWLLKGIGAFFTPEAFGGGLERAGEDFDRSLELFEVDDPERPLPRWGRADAHLWRGRVHEGFGQVDQARAEYETALLLEPEYVWVRDVLLPGLASDSAGHDHDR